MEDNQTIEEEGILEEADSNEELESETNDTDTSGDDGDNQNSTPDVIAKLKEITGREFKDEEDFKKHYKNLSSYVGKKVAPKVEPKAPTDRVAELEFKVEHPELKGNFDIIKMVATSKGVSYEDAINDNIVKEVLEERKGKKGESVIHSNNKISSNNSSIAKLKQNVNTEEGLTAYLNATMED